MNLKHYTYIVRVRLFLLFFIIAQVLDGSSYRTFERISDPFACITRIQKSVRHCAVFFDMAYPTCGPGKEILPLSGAGPTATTLQPRYALKPRGAPGSERHAGPACGGAELSRDVDFVLS